MQGHAAGRSRNTCALFGPPGVPVAKRRPRNDSPGRAITNILRWKYGEGFVDLMELFTDRRRLGQWSFRQLHDSVCVSRHRGGRRFEVIERDGVVWVRLSNHLRKSRSGRGPRDHPGEAPVDSHRVGGIGRTGLEALDEQEDLCWTDSDGTVPDKRSIRSAFGLDPDATQQYPEEEVTPSMLVDPQLSVPPEMIPVSGPGDNVTIFDQRYSRPTVSMSTGAASGGSLDLVRDSHNKMPPRRLTNKMPTIEPQNDEPGGHDVLFTDDPGNVEWEY